MMMNKTNTKKAKSEIDYLKEISDKIDKLIGLLAVKNETSEKKIKILSNLGFTSNEIGAILDMNPSTIRNARIDKKSVKRGKKWLTPL